MKPQVTIVCLIYRSPEYARELHRHLLLSTPELASGEAAFFYVANNANRRTLAALRRNRLPHFEFRSPVATEAEHSRKGFAPPEYLGRVYTAYNVGVELSTTDAVVLINSDMAFSPGWLQALLALDDGKSAVAAQLVERNHPRFGVFPGAIEADFGSTFADFRRDQFIDWTRSQRSIGTTAPGGPYMPVLIRKSWFQAHGGFPRGNPKPQGDEPAFGDVSFFDTLARHGIQHITATGAFCYHFKEGERTTEPLAWWWNRARPALVAPLRPLAHRLRSMLREKR